jgi:hypothetical protein
VKSRDSSQRKLTTPQRRLFPSLFTSPNPQPRGAFESAPRPASPKTRNAHPPPLQLAGPPPAGADSSRSRARPLLPGGREK